MKRISMWLAAVAGRAAAAGPGTGPVICESAGSQAKASEAAKPVVAVFRLNGAMTGRRPTMASVCDGADNLAEDLRAALAKPATTRTSRRRVTIGDASLGLAQIEELRQAITQVREAGRGGLCPRRFAIDVALPAAGARPAEHGADRRCVTDA
jgi:hypothetical protein